MASISKRCLNGLINSIICVFDFINRRKHFLDKKNPRILVVSTTALGDSLWATPVLRAIKEQLPQCYLAVLTGPLGAQVFQGNPYIDDLYLYRRGIFKLWFQLYKKQFQAVLIFHASQRIIFPLVRLLRTSVIAGLKGQMKELDAFATHLYLRDDNHAVDYRFRLASTIGVHKTNDSCFLSIEDQDRLWADDYIKSFGDTLVIGIHPGASKNDRQWPEDRFVALGQWLCQHPKVHVIVSGGTNEQQLCTRIASQIPRATIFYGQTLHKFAALIEKMSLFICNDTGPIHLAAMSVSPIIGLYRAKRIIPYCRPYRERGISILTPPGDSEDIKMISQVVVQEAIKKLRSERCSEFYYFH